MKSSPRRRIPNTTVARSRAEIGDQSQKLKSGEDVFRLLSVLGDALEFVEGFVDGAPDCSRTSKSANYLALQLRTEINKWDKQRSE